MVVRVGFLGVMQVTTMGQDQNAIQNMQNAFALLGGDMGSASCTPQVFYTGDDTHQVCVGHCSPAWPLAEVWSLRPQRILVYAEHCS